MSKITHNDVLSYVYKQEAMENRIRKLIEENERTLEYLKERGLSGIVKKETIESEIIRFEFATRQLKLVLGEKENENK